MITKNTKLSVKGELVKKIKNQRLWEYFPPIIKIGKGMKVRGMNVGS